MDLPQLLVIGKNGQVGWELCRILAPLGSVRAVDYPEIDFANEAGLRQLVRETRPAAIFNAAAYTAVDKAESDEAACAQANTRAPQILAEEACAAGALLVHFSTDYVHDGTKPVPYVESDTTNPLSAYGRTKLAGDLAVQASGCDHLIFRLCWVYGTRGKNFLLTMQKLAREREQLRVVSDQFGAPTWSRMIAQATAYAARQALAATDRAALNGVYHLCAGGRTSWHGFTEAIVRRVPEDARKCRVVEAIPTSAYPTPARRPANSAMNTDKLFKTFGLRLPAWETSLEQAIDVS